MDKPTMDKLKICYTLQNRWLALALSKISLSKYFLDRNIKRVIIYGAGELGKRLYDDLSSNGVTVEFFIDKYTSGGTVWKGYETAEVLSLEDFSDYAGECQMPIVVTPVHLYYEALDEIKKSREDVELFIISLNDIINALYPQKIIPYMVMSVGQACNFKCKNCSDLAPYTLSEFKRYDVDYLIETLQTLLDSVDCLQSLQIQGGEPFLYTSLETLLRYVGTHKKIRSVTIATNGSVIPDNEMLKLIKDFGISIRISDYKFARTSAEKLYEKLLSLDIKCYYYRFTSGISQWYFKGGPDMKREDDDVIVMDRFKYCKNNVCLTLERGRLSYCSRAANAYAIQHFQDGEEDSLQITPRTSLGNEIMNFISHKHPIEACRYCYGTDDEYMVDAAEQI